MFPATGSTITAATRFSERSAETDSRSLYRAMRVSETVPGGTPGLDGSPKVAMPDPALDQEWIAVAVVTAFELDECLSTSGGAGESDD